MDAGNIRKGNAVIMTTALIFGVVGFMGIIFTGSTLEDTSYASVKGKSNGVTYNYYFGFRAFYDADVNEEGYNLEFLEDCDDDYDTNVGSGVIAFVSLLIAFIMALSRVCSSCGSTSKCCGITTFCFTVFATLFAIVAFGSYMNGCYQNIEDDFELSFQLIIGDANATTETQVGAGAGCWIVSFLSLIVASGLTGYEVFIVNEFDSQGPSLNTDK